MSPPGRARPEAKSRMEDITMKKCYLVVELASGKAPKIIGLYKTRRAAESAAYTNATSWRNIIELPLQD